MVLRRRTAMVVGLAVAEFCLAGGARAAQYHSQELVAPATTAPRQSPQQMLAHTRDPYVRAMLLRDLAAQAATAKRYSQAAGYLRKALNENALSAPAQALMRQQLTALLTASGDPHALVTALTAQQRSGKTLTAAQQAALGGAYTRLKQYTEALPLLKTAVSAARTPPVAWLRALAVAQIGAGLRKQALPILQRIVAAAPNSAADWLRLARVQLRLGQQKDALTTLELAARLGFVDSSAWRLRLVALLGKNDMPFRAASLLQQDLEGGRIDDTAKSWTTLGALWVQARERAMAITAYRHAIKLGSGSGLYRQIGELALQIQDYGAATQALAKAGHAPATLMQLGAAYFHAGRFTRARAAFHRAAQAASKTASKTAKQAQQWLAFLSTRAAQIAVRLAAGRSPPQLAPARLARGLSQPNVNLSAPATAATPVVTGRAASRSEKTGAGSAATSAAATGLGGRLTPVGAERAASADGTVPRWAGGLTPAHWPKGWHRGERLVNPFPQDKPLFTVTAQNAARYRKYLAPGYRRLFSKYPDYKMVVYPSRRTVSYPQAIYTATRANLGRARLKGPDALVGARLGFPFPRPDNGVEVMWNHRARYRGSSMKAHSTQAVVYPNGQRQYLHQTELLYSRYANIADPGDIAQHNRLLDYLTWFTQPGGGFDFAALVLETANSLKKPRAVWVMPPHMSKLFRIPPVGYDQPFPGSDGINFIDMVDMYNGPFNRYVWKLEGKRELLIPYNDYRLVSGQYSYNALLQPHHFNQNAVRYEMHRVWKVVATLRQGKHHAFGKRVFYVDEDSWNIVLVDNYDHDGHLWRFQEGHLLSFYGVQAATCAPVVTYDFKSGAYFVNHLMGHDPVPEFHLKHISGRDFLPSTVRARFGH